MTHCQEWLATCWVPSASYETSQTQLMLLSWKPQSLTLAFHNVPQQTPAVARECKIVKLDSWNHWINDKNTTLSSFLPPRLVKTKFSAVTWSFFFCIIIMRINWKCKHLKTKPYKKFIFPENIDGILVTKGYFPSKKGWLEINKKIHEICSLINSSFSETC